MHLLNHFSDCIWFACRQINCQLERLDRAMVDFKQAYRQSSLQESTYQICWTKARRDVSQYWERNANAAKQHHNYEMPLTSSPITATMNNPQPEIKPLDDLAEWCAIQNGQLQNHISLCFKRFANSTDYVVYDQYLSCPNSVKYIRYTAVTKKVMSSQCYK